MIEIGTVLQDRFLIEERIGVGGMGAVYRAVDKKFGTAVAIKETFYRDKDLAEAFEREARLLNGLHHPLFAHVSDHFTQEEGHFLVMEYIEGEDLSELLKRGEKFPFETIMSWTLDLLDGLDYLHSQDPPIIHRDIKPSNLKLTSRGNIVLLDFGMAKETSGNTQGMRSVFGYSRRYSPLEQIEGTGTDVRSDVFSLGATVYHLLTGSPPVDVLRRASAIVAGGPDPIESASTINPDVPERVAAILDSALALNPNRRFRSARAMWSALEHSLNGARLSAAGAIAAPVFAAPVVRPPVESPETKSFPALEAFEAEVDTGAGPSVSSPLFCEVNDDDPIAALVALRVAQMRESGGAPGEDVPGRIEVPVMSEPTPVPEDLQELWVADESALDREDVVTPIPIAHPVAAPGWFNYPALFGIPLLLLVLGLGAYGLFRNYPGEEAIQENPEEQVTAPENAPGAALTPTETTSATQTPVPNEEPELTQSGQPGGEEQIATETFEQRRNENSNPEHSSAYRSAAPPKRQAPAERTTERNRTTASNRTGRATRPRVVDEDFEQPPVSSIESIMTGIPADRPRRQSRWEVWEEDQLRRERRIRRRNRRNLQRYPLY